MKERRQLLSDKEALGSLWTFSGFWLKGGKVSEGPGLCCRIRHCRSKHWIGRLAELCNPQVPQLLTLQSDSFCLFKFKLFIPVCPPKKKKTNTISSYVMTLQVVLASAEIQIEQQRHRRPNATESASLHAQHLLPSCLLPRPNPVNDTRHQAAVINGKSKLTNRVSCSTRDETRNEQPAQRTWSSCLQVPRNAICPWNRHH